MLLLRFGFALTSCSFLLPVGCQTLRVAAQPAPEIAAVAQLSSPPNQEVATHLGPFEKPTEQQALAKVLPDLRAIQQADPAAHAQLLEQFGQAEPSMWSALAQRARSTLAYKKQLAGGPAAALSAAPPVSDKAPTAAAASRVVPTQFTEPVADKVSPPTPPNRLPAVEPVATQVVSPPPVVQATVVSTPSASTPQPGSVQPHIIENPHIAKPVMPAVASASDSKGEVRLVTAIEPSSSTDDKEPSAEDPTDWRASLDATIAVFEASLPETPRSSEEAYQHARLRLLQLAAGRQGPAVSAISGLSSTEQGFWSKELFALSTLMDSARQPDRKLRAAAAALHQGEALDQLRQLGTLQIRNLTFCSEVYGFGAYESLEEAKFRAGEGASLYAEIDNYRSVSTERGFHTSITTSYRVEDLSGRLVDEGEFPLVEDDCLTRRRDFHITYGVTLPTAIYPGDYLLRLTITDQLGDKIGEDSVPFTIVAP